MTSVYMKENAGAASPRGAASPLWSQQQQRTSPSAQQHGPASEWLALRAHWALSTSSHKMKALENTHLQKVGETRRLSVRKGERVALAGVLAKGSDYWAVHLADTVATAIDPLTQVRIGAAPESEGLQADDSAGLSGRNAYGFGAGGFRRPKHRRRLICKPVSKCEQSGRDAEGDEREDGESREPVVPQPPRQPRKRRAPGGGGRSAPGVMREASHRPLSSHLRSAIQQQSLSERARPEPAAQKQGLRSGRGLEAVLVSPRGGRLPSTLPFSRRLGMLRRRTQSSRELSRCVAVLHKKPGQEDRSWVEKLPAL